MFVIQRVLEVEGKLTLLDQNRVIRPHSGFRLFSTANTVGLGDTTGLYHGTHVTTRKIRMEATMECRTVRKNGNRGLRGSDKHHTGTDGRAAAGYSDAGRPENQRGPSDRRFDAHDA